MEGDFGPYEVPEDSYFMLGDNRNWSKDSRFWNNTYVKRDAILGKAVLRYSRLIKSVLSSRKRRADMGTWNSRGLRGSTLEELINRTNEQYREKGLALIQKIPTPITPIKNR